MGHRLLTFYLVNISSGLNFSLHLEFQMIKRFWHFAEVEKCTVRSADIRVVNSKYWQGHIDIDNAIDNNDNINDDNDDIDYHNNNVDNDNEQWMNPFFILSGVLSSNRSNKISPTTSKKRVLLKMLVRILYSLLCMIYYLLSIREGLKKWNFPLSRGISNGHFPLSFFHFFLLQMA